MRSLLQAGAVIGLAMSVQGCSYNTVAEHDRCVVAREKWFIGNEKGPPNTPQVDVLPLSDGSISVDGKVMSSEELLVRLRVMRNMNPVPTINVITKDVSCEQIKVTTELVAREIACDQSICLLN